MKGLLLKDFYMIVKYCRAYLFLILVFLAVSVTGNENMFLVSYPCLLSGLIPVTLLIYDERSKWLEYSGTLPYTRAQIVSGKYLIGLCLQLSVLLLTGVVQAVKMYRGGAFAWGAFLEMMSLFYLMACAASSLGLPFMFKWGVAKGQIIYYVMVGFICAGAFVLSSSFGAQQGNVFGGGILLCAAGVVIYALSWWLSVVIYRKREI